MGCERCEQALKEKPGINAWSAFILSDLEGKNSRQNNHSQETTIQVLGHIKDAVRLSLAVYKCLAMSKLRFN